MLPLRTHPYVFIHMVYINPVGVGRQADTLLTGYHQVPWEGLGKRCIRAEPSDFGALGFATWPRACASSSVSPRPGSEHPVTRWGFFQNMIIDYSWPRQGGEDGQVGLHKDCLVPSQSCKQSLCPARSPGCSLQRVGNTEK